MVEPHFVDDADSSSILNQGHTADTSADPGAHPAFHKWLEISGTSRTEFARLLMKSARRDSWPASELESCLSWISTTNTDEPMPPLLLRTVLDEVAAISQEAVTVTQRMSTLHQAGANLADLALRECTRRYHETTQALNGHRCERPDLDSGETAATLTHREKQVLQLVSSGNSNRKIARTLGLAEQTVKNHLTSAFMKLNAADRTSAVLTALRQRLITDPASTAAADEAQ